MKIVKKPFNEVFQEIEQYFDFEKVYKTMKALDWTWDMGNGKKGIPSLETIKEVAKKYLLQAYEDELGSIGSGGFVCGYDNGNLWISFRVEEWDTNVSE